MTHKLFQFTVLLVLCYLFSTIKCSEDKNKKSTYQNGLRFYQIEPAEWWRSLIYSGQNRNLRNLDSLSKLKNQKLIGDPNKKAKLFDKSDMQLANDNQISELDEIEPVGATDFELINFWPGLNKRDTDYGHLR